MRPELPHACFSITKSYAATIAATLLHEGALDESRTVAFYLPEMIGTAYEHATLRQVLDMRIGVAYSETYADPSAQFWDYARAGGLKPLPNDYQGPRGFHDFLMTLRQEGGHGGPFAYKTVNTEVLCWVMRRVTGMAFNLLLSSRLWSQLDCEADGYLTLDPQGIAMGGAGLAATLRDLVRFGEMLRCEGATGTRQVVPAAVVAAIRQGGDRQKFALGAYPSLTGYSYTNMWWVTHNEHGAFEARGIHGQRLYIAPAADLVVARFASHPVAGSVANDPISVPAMVALGRMLRHR